MVEAAFIRTQQRARVLTTIAVPLANGLRAELRALLGHLGEVQRHNHCRHADRATHVCTALSQSRIGSVIHSSHVTGRMRFSPSISSAVATLVAIWQNASAGVR